MELKFEVNKLDPCLMICTNEERIVISCIYVDDILLIGHMGSVQCAINDIESKIDIRKERPLNDYLVWIIKINGDRGSIHQSHFLKKTEYTFGHIVKDIEKRSPPCAHRVESYET